MENHKWWVLCLRDMVSGGDFGVLDYIFVGFFRIRPLAVSQDYERSDNLSFEIRLYGYIDDPIVGEIVPFMWLILRMTVDI